MIENIRDGVRQSFYEDPDQRLGVSDVVDIVEESAGSTPLAVIREIVVQEFRKARRPVRRG
jgi:hypothetical protein